MLTVLALTSVLAGPDPIPITAEQFDAFYEIDRTSDQYIVPLQGSALGLPVGLHLASLGGYGGSEYQGSYNGFVGFPGRQTDKQLVRGWLDGETIKLSRPSGPSVSWKDSGLPIFIPDTACIIPE